MIENYKALLKPEEEELHERLEQAHARLFAQQENPSFQMKDAVCGFSADFQTTFQTNTFWIHQSAFY